MSVLTTRQQEVLEFIQDFMASRKMSPTIRDIMNHFNWSSNNAVVCHLEVLRSKGYLTWERGLSRSIQVTKEASGIPIVNLAEVDR